MISRRDLFRLVGGGTLLALVPKAATPVLETVVASPLTGPTAAVLTLDEQYFRDRYLVPAMKALWDDYDRRLLALVMEHHKD